MKTNVGDTICLRLSIINPEMSKDILQNFLDTMQTGDGFCGTKLTAIARHDIFNQNNRLNKEINALIEFIDDHVMSMLDDKMAAVLEKIIDGKETY